MNDAIPATPGTRIVATVLDPDAIDVPGVILGLAAGATTHRLRVLVRTSRGTFHTATYDFPATTPAPATVRHAHLSLPGARLRQVWTDLGRWDLLDIAAGRRGPHGGDAVRLATPVAGWSTGEIGVLLGVIGRPLRLPVATIVVHPPMTAAPAPSTGNHPMGSGRLLLVAVRDLAATGQRLAVPAWRWRAGAAERVTAEDPVTVRLWDWTPGRPS